MNDSYDLRVESIKLAMQLDTPNKDTKFVLENAEKIFKYILGTKKPAPSENQYSCRTKIDTPYGTKDFVPFAHQKRMFQYLNSNHNVIINSARQMGVTTTLTDYVTNYAETNQNKVIVWMSDTFIHAKASIEIGFYCRRLNATMATSDVIKFQSGSKIIIRALTEEALRGLSADLIVVDNAAYVSHSKFYGIWKTIDASMNPGSRKFLASTPCEDYGVFYDVWQNSGSNWRKLLLPWYEHPDRDEAWEAEQLRLLGIDKFKREYYCEFTPKPVNQSF
jgi:hypothetical protein